MPTTRRSKRTLWRQVPTDADKSREEISPVDKSTAKEPPITSRLIPGGAPRRGMPTTQSEMTPLRQRLYEKAMAELQRLTRLATAVRDKDEKKAINSERIQIACLIGIIHVADEELLGVYDDDESPKDAAEAFGMLIFQARSAKFVLNGWAQIPSLAEHFGEVGPANPRPSTSSTAQKKMRANCGEMCLVTRNRGASDGAHIIPDCVTRAEQRGMKFWAGIRMFWGKEKVQKLKEVLRDPDGAIRNILSLDATAHRYYGRGYFALRPVASKCTNATLAVDLFWLEKDATDLLAYKQGDYNLADWSERPSPTPIKNGDRIMIRTKDYRKYPLPSADLLNLQWSLNRALRAIAAAEILQLLFSPDTDDPPPEIDLIDYQYPSTPLPRLAKFLVLEAHKAGIIRTEDVLTWIETYAFEGEGERDEQDEEMVDERVADKRNVDPEDDHQQQRPSDTR